MQFLSQNDTTVAHIFFSQTITAGITSARLASYDRAITAEPPRFAEQQLANLAADLTAYRRTLAAVHSGADLAAAIDGVLGYDAGECKGKRVTVAPLPGVATPAMRRLLGAVLLMVQGGSGSGTPSGSRPGTPSGGGSSGSKVGAMVEMERCLKLQALVVAARRALVPALRGGNRACHGRCEQRENDDCHV